MPMAIFHSRCPETAEAETRTFTALEDTGHPGRRVRLCRILLRRGRVRLSPGDFDGVSEAGFRAVPGDNQLRSGRLPPFIGNGRMIRGPRSPIPGPGPPRRGEKSSPSGFPSEKYPAAFRRGVQAVLRGKRRPWRHRWDRQRRRASGKWHELPAQVVRANPRSSTCSSRKERRHSCLDFISLNPPRPQLLHPVRSDRWGPSPEPSASPFAGAYWANSPTGAIPPSPISPPRWAAIPT